MQLRKIHLWLWYMGSAIIFEGTLSMLLLIIGLVFFNNNWYYFLTSAFLGGIWSHRVVDVYYISRRIYENTFEEAEDFVNTSIFNASGHSFRIHITVFPLVVIIILMFILYFY
jgi:hypothetical protein